MHHIVQPISLYGNLVSQHHYDGADGRTISLALPSITTLFSVVRKYLGKTITIALQHLCVRHRQHSLFVIFATLLLTAPFSGHAEGAEKSDLVDAPEKFNATAQTTWIVAEHGAFRSPYVGTNSLMPQHEKAYTWTVTGYLGYRPFANTELYFDPEMIQSNQFSGKSPVVGGGAPSSQMVKSRRTSARHT